MKHCFHMVISFLRFVACSKMLFSFDLFPNFLPLWMHEFWRSKYTPYPYCLQLQEPVFHYQECTLLISDPASACVSPALRWCCCWFLAIFLIYSALQFLHSLYVFIWYNSDFEGIFEGIYFSSNGGFFISSLSLFQETDRCSTLGQVIIYCCMIAFKRFRKAMIKVFSPEFFISFSNTF